MDVFEVKNKRYRKQVNKLSRNKFLRSRPRVAMFVVSFANSKSPALGRDPSGDRVMPRAEVRVRAQASHGNITVLSHLKQWRNFKSLKKNSGLSEIRNHDLYDTTVQCSTN